MVRISYIFLFICPFTAILFGTCAKAQEIGAVLAGDRSPFWVSMANGIRTACKESGVTCVVRSPVDDDLETVEQGPQIKMMRSLVGNGAQGIILAPMPIPAGAAKYVPPVPLIAVDRPSDDYDPLSTVSSDNYGAGLAAASLLKGRLPKGAKVGVFRLAPHVTSTTDRENGFIKGVKDLGLDVVLDTYVGHGTHIPQDTATAVFAAYTGHLDAVFAPTSYITLGLLGAQRTLDPGSRPLIIGFDYWPGFDDAIRNGNLLAAVIQDSFSMGYQSVQQMIKAMAGQRVEKKMGVNFVIATADTIAMPAVRSVVNNYVAAEGIVQ